MASPPYKLLVRSSSNRVWLGICGGLGEYLSVDPVLIRLLFLVATVFSGFLPGLLVYVLAAFVVPPARQK